VSSKYRHQDAEGRYYRLSDLTGPGKRSGASGQKWRGFNPADVGRHWQPPSYCYAKYKELTGADLAQFPLLERLDQLDEIGLIRKRSAPSTAPAGESGRAAPRTMPHCRGPRSAAGLRSVRERHRASGARNRWPASMSRPTNGYTEGVISKVKVTTPGPTDYPSSTASASVSS
jgi:hypothetical protein